MFERAPFAFCIALAVYGGHGLAPGFSLAGCQASSASSAEQEQDIVLLQSGGRLAGKVTEFAETTPPSILVATPDGQQWRFARSQVRQVIQASEHLSEYQEKLRTMPDTLEGHLEMAGWCKENLESKRFRNGPNRLSPQRRFHLQEILRFDPDHQQARALLGFSKSAAGDWINLEQVRLANGMVEFEGKWVTNEQLQILKGKENWEKQVADWRGKLRRLRNANTAEVAAAQETVKGIKDPSAVGELIELIKKEEDLGWLLAFIEALGNMPPRSSAGVLADLAVLHADQGIREKCLALLKQEGVDRAAVADRLVLLYLKGANAQINRAGFVLGELQQSNAVLPLIDALVTPHLVNNPNGGGSGSIAAGFTPNGQQGGGGGLTFGNDQPAQVKVELENQQVLEGLRRLTGVSFNFDEARWKAWYAETHTLREPEMRRD